MTVRLHHPWSGDSQDQEMFLATYTDKQICHYDTECSDHHLSLSTLRSKKLRTIYPYERAKNSKKDVSMNQPNLTQLIPY